VIEFCTGASREPPGGARVAGVGRVPNTRSLELERAGVKVENVGFGSTAAADERSAHLRRGGRERTIRDVHIAIQQGEVAGTTPRTVTGAHGLSHQGGLVFTIHRLHRSG